MIEIESKNIESGNRVTIVRLVYGKANALDLEFCEKLSAEFSTLGEFADAVILTGKGNIFSAGVDLKRLLDDGPDYALAFVAALDRLCEILFTFDRPLVAAINGHAIAGGCILAQTADWRIMTDGKARIGVPELLVGVPFPTFVFEILRAVVPAQLFRSWFILEAYTAPQRRWSADLLTLLLIRRV